MDKIIQYWRIFGKDMPKLAAGIVILILAFVFVYKIRKKRSERETVLSTTILDLVITSVVLAILFITETPIGNLLRHQNNFNLYLLPLFHGDTEYVINVIMFLVFSLLLAFRTRANIKVIIVGMAFSVCIEVSQYLLPTGRILSLTDFVLNSIGTVIGFALVGFVIRFKSTRKSMNKETVKT
jgi:glycopeptide antibiotics resistance protein